MSSPTQADKLETLSPVDIEAQGVFKYVLIEAYANDGDPNNIQTEVSKLLVRGYSRAEYHADIYEECEEKEIRGQGLDAQCLGGGRIIHTPKDKYLKVYGYSVAYGKADHSKAVELLQVKYPDYKIEQSDEGY
ncbi:PHPT1 [Lepeophtheirus salmonis]|uniref:PHPT1 n=2 Tax=Lepeophtheirus salmonis TaxID=72036 RepID=D3PJ67_LEPSM|nr:Sex-regulated protein janus-A [Lepeophtheirus salmonis]CAB4057037.1 PHPT1 [Lepeophtheirus salmonis]CAF2809559.1 PHPT1 [Lepeophtheirus salmonis]